MNSSTVDIDPVVAAQTTKNLDLARRLVVESLAHPERYPETPNDASLVIVPYDDPELGVLNLGLANKRVAAGESIRLQRVGVPGSDDLEATGLRRLEELATHRSPRWPLAAASDLVVPAYDPDED